MAKRQVKWLVREISDGVKGCCINAGRVGKGKDSGQSGERERDNYVFCP